MKDIDDPTLTPAELLRDHWTFHGVEPMTTSENIIEHPDVMLFLAGTAFLTPAFDLPRQMLDPIANPVETRTEASRLFRRRFGLSHATISRSCLAA
jgi:hypothetical protein